MTSTHLFITFEARPEARAALAAMLNHVGRTLPQVPGCVGVRVFAHAGQPDRFSLLEEWHSIEAHQAHVERLVASGEWERIRAHLAADPTSFYLLQGTVAPTLKKVIA